MQMRVWGNRGLASVAAVLSVLLVVWLVLAPAESRLGQVVKLVYIHGALVWVGLFTFSLAGALGLVAFLLRHVARMPGRAAIWYRGTTAAGWAALLVWGVYALSSMAVTGLTWGQWIAWGEPRVRATAAIFIAALVVRVVSRLVAQCDFTALANLAMGVVPWVLISQAEAIRHPADPIGGSGSAAIQGFYLAIVLTVLALAMTLVAWLWMRETEMGERDREGACAGDVSD